MGSGVLGLRNSMPAVLREKERPIDFGYIDTLGCNRNYFDFVLKIARNDFVATHI